MYTARAILINDKIKFIDDMPFENDTESEYIVLVTFVGKDLNSTLFGKIDEKIASLGEYQQDLFGNLSQEELAQEYRKAKIGLTKREQEILQLIQQGLTNIQIGDKLELNSGTVRNYISSIYEKLKAVNRTSAVAKAVELGLLE